MNEGAGEYNQRCITAPGMPLMGPIGPVDWVDCHDFADIAVVHLETIVMVKRRSVLSWACIAVISLFSLATPITSTDCSSPLR